MCKADSLRFVPTAFMVESGDATLGRPFGILKLLGTTTLSLFPSTLRSVSTEFPRDSPLATWSGVDALLTC